MHAGSEYVAGDLNVRVGWGPGKPFEGVEIVRIRSTKSGTLAVARSNIHHAHGEHMRYMDVTVTEQYETDQHANITYCSGCWDCCVSWCSLWSHVHCQQPLVCRCSVCQCARMHSYLHCWHKEGNICFRLFCPNAARCQLLPGQPALMFWKCTLPRRGAISKAMRMHGSSKVLYCTTACDWPPSWRLAGCFLNRTTSMGRRTAARWLRYQMACCFS